MAWLTVGLVVFIVLEIAWTAAPAVKHYGLGFLATDSWDANANSFGVRPEVWGTLYSSVLAVLIGTVFGLSVAIFLSERFLSSFVFQVLRFFRVEYHSYLGPDIGLMKCVPIPA